MAPDPTQEVRSAGSVITGHKISLNVHYDETDSQTGRFKGKVTPVNEVVAHFGSLNINGRKSEIISRQHSELNLKTEEATEQRSICSSITDVRPETPNSHLTDQETDNEKTFSAPVKAEPLRNGFVPLECLNGPDQIIPTNAIKSWEPHGAVKLKIGDTGLSSRTPISVPSLFRSIVERYPKNKAFAVKKDGQWEYTTYDQYYLEVKAVAKAFIKLGLEKFHGVCILGFNSPEWFISYLAGIFAGGASAGIYTTNSAESCEHCAQNCMAQIWVVEDQKQLDKVLKIQPNLPNLKAVIQYRGKPTVEGVFSWEEIVAMGRQESEEILQSRLKSMAINQCCSLIYTSGTTGVPKGVMLSHDNMTWTAQANCSFVGVEVGKERIVSYLPLSHVAAQMADIYVSMYIASTVYFAEPDALKGTLGQTLKEVRPTLFLGVPRVWEKIQEKMLEIGKKTKGLKKSIATWAKAIGTDTNQRKQIHDYSKPLGYTIAKAVVFNKVKQALGLDECKVLLSGAAPIAPEVVNYFQSLDICLTDIYGMSESSGPHTIGLEKGFKNGSAGLTTPGCYTKIDGPDMGGNGEICMGGRNVCMGYLLMQDKTHEAIDDNGWLHTGDIGKIDKDGFLFITGRLKELLITAGGENVPPVLIEDILKGEVPAISNAMLIGDRRKFLSILITLKTNLDDEGAPLDTLAPSTVDWCKSLGSTSKTVQDVVSNPDVLVMNAIQEGINRTNIKSTSNAQKIQKWTILPNDFSIPGDELGPTLKLKRPVVLKKYNETIEKFYT